MVKKIAACCIRVNEKDWEDLKKDAEFVQRSVANYLIWVWKEWRKKK